MACRIAARSIAAVALALPAAAHAQAPEGAEAEPDVKAQCAAAYESSQEKRKAGELILAREQLKICVRDACPSFVRDECSEWLE